MSEVQKVKIPVYVSEFLDKFKNKGVGLIALLQELTEIHTYYYNGFPSSHEDYRKVMVASWVEKVKGDKTYDGLAMIVLDAYKNGYEAEYVNREFVIYDKSEDEFLDKYFTLSPMAEAMRFNTKEEAKKFILNNYEIQEIYDYED